LAGVLLSVTISEPPARGTFAETLPVNIEDEALPEAPTLHPANNPINDNTNVIPAYFIYRATQ